MEDRDEASRSWIVMPDANQIVNRSWWLDSPEWTLLLHLASGERIELLMSEVVRKEVVGRFRERVISTLNKFDGTRRTLQDLTHGTIERHDFEVERSVANYEDHLAATGGLVGGEGRRPPDVDPITLVERAVARQRPFNDNGEGFRDTLLWLTVLEAAHEAAQSTVVLITNDNAFYDGEGSEMHRDLLAELEAKGRKNVTVLRSINDFLAEAGHASPETMRTVVSEIGKQKGHLADVLKEELTGIELTSSHVVGGSAFITDVDIEGITYGRSTDPDGDDELVLIEMDVTCRAEMDLHFDDAATPLVDSTSDRAVIVASANYRVETGTFENLQVPDLRLDTFATALRELRDATSFRLVQPATRRWITTPEVLEWATEFGRLKEAARLPLVDQVDMTALQKSAADAERELSRFKAVAAGADEDLKAMRAATDAARELSRFNEAAAAHAKELEAIRAAAAQASPFWTAISHPATEAAPLHNVPETDGDETSEVDERSGEGEA